MSNRIEQVISDIEEYIDGCKLQAFSNTKIIVERPQIEEYLNELRQYTPEEVKKYQRMLNNRDKILSDAKKKAQEIEDKAQAYAEKKASEHEITQLAYEKATEIIHTAQEEAAKTLSNANAEATAVRQGSLQYANDILSSLHSIVTGTLEDCQSRFSGTISALMDHQNIIEQNAIELNSANRDVEENTAEEKAPRETVNEFNVEFAADEDDEDDSIELED
ncbi:MAG: hypothetical protein J6Z23_07725 [Lachnospiraceae bacterium]|nr:hypothetical protein [Lachnospiraceae bacterium]MBP5255249.1 hypothetical protein [Lachnospiraceae bacterium]